MLSPQERERYDRQMMLEGFGEAGQERLKKAKVFIAGAGGLGSPVSIYLAVAGVGQIHIVDKDVVELSNLNRQILHWDRDIRVEKAKSAQEKLSQLNPDTEVKSVVANIDDDTVLDLVGDCDLIVDAMDNYPTRYVLNRAALAKGIPLCHGSIYGLEGMTTTIIPGQTPCLRCIFPQAPPPTKFPVVGVTPAVIGCIQATEVIKYLVGLGELLANRLLIYDGWSLKFREVNIKRDPRCPDCSHLATPPSA
ncbi:MAG TPA: HesA/MoeB/ThiF family protein [Dehalococcoidia bacterium]|nr:HesA/MoeB/ThiF family protein [Dehalococcoidia bacterium]